MDEKPTKPTVLFVCTGNSARSQMAEGLLRRYAGDLLDSQSAGTDPKGVNPLSIEAMREVGIDISGHRSKNLTEFAGADIRYAIFVCASADDRCPTLAGFTGTRLNWPFEDPAAATGTHDEKLGVFRDVRDQIEGQLINWLAELKKSGELSAVPG